MNTRRTFLLLCVSSALVLSGCGGESGGGGGFQFPPTSVETAMATTGAVTEQFTTIGTIEAAEDIEVTAEIDGIVVELPFREGGYLAAGALMARMDDSQLRAEAQRAGALRDQYHATWQRVQNVVDNGAGAPQDLDDAIAALKVAEANLALAETRLAKTRIVAPFSGYAGRRHVSRGAFLRAGAPITELARIDRLRVSFAVPEQILHSLKPGGIVRVSTTALPGESRTGEIDFIEPQLDPRTRNAGVVALIANDDEMLRPGMSANIRIVLAERPDALTVPSRSVFVEGGQAFVYSVQPDSTVARVAVELGARLADAVEILDGLDVGQQVVAAGHQKLYPGARVNPVVPDAPTDAGNR